MLLDAFSGPTDTNGKGSADGKGSTDQRSGMESAWEDRVSPLANRKFMGFVMVRVDSGLRMMGQGIYGVSDSRGGHKRAQDFFKLE